MNSYTELINTKNIKHDDWLTYRRKGIGGSEAAAIMGMNAYCSPLTIYYDKIGMKPDVVDNEAMRVGRDLEAYVAKRFMEQTGLKVQNYNAILQSNEHPYMLANIDRRIVGEHAGLECKTTNAFNKTDFEGGNVPPNYYWQCQHYMAVTGWDLWYLAVLVMGRSFHVIKIERNQDYIDVLIDKEEKLWKHNVCELVPPLPSGIDAEDDLIKCNISQKDGEIQLDNGINYTLEALERLSERRKGYEKEEKSYKQKLVMLLDGHESGYTDKYTIRNKEVVSNRLDTKSLKKDHPDIAEQYSKQSISTRLNIKEIKA